MRKLLPRDKPLSFSHLSRPPGAKLFPEDSQKIFSPPAASRRNPVKAGTKSFVWKIYKKLTNEFPGKNSQDISREAILFNSLPRDIELDVWLAMKIWMYQDFYFDRIMIFIRSDLRAILSLIEGYGVLDEILDALSDDG